jgi:hypothetical protein
MEFGGVKSFLITSDFFIGAKDYIVVGQNKNFSSRFGITPTHLVIPSNWPVLSNSGGRFILKDWLGSTIDSLDYWPAWGGGEGISLERKRPDADANASASWGSCVYLEGGTPGKINSIFAGASSRKITIAAEPNPFFVDQGEQTKIIVELPLSTARVTMKIYDNQGRLINTLLNNSPSGSHREIFWNGKDRNGNVARMGIYILYVEVIDEISGFNKSSKKTVVVGRKL